MKIKQDKGQAGLTILLSVVVLLFIIGLLVAIFSIMGGELQESSYDRESGTVTNETLATVDGVGELLTKSTLRGVLCVVSHCLNQSGNEVIPTTNWTYDNCRVKAVGSGQYNNSNFNCSYTYSYDEDNTATDVMNDTVVSIASVSEWFDIFVVITAMIVLIALVIIIIVSIKGSGMIAGGGSGANNVGTA